MTIESREDLLEKFSKTSGCERGIRSLSEAKTESSSFSDRYLGEVMSISGYYIAKQGGEWPVVNCLVANKKNDVWSWDVSQIRSDIRYQRFYLYVIIDIWSRFVVGF